jgi:YfiH family protein
MSVIRPACFDALPEVIAAVSTREGGVSPPPLGMNLSLFVGDDPDNVRRNRELFFGSLDIGISDLAFAGQIHSAHVARVERSGTYRDCDALITNVKCKFLCISIADCVPILIFDPTSEAVAAVHAGWRGTLGGIVGVAVRRLVEEYGCSPGAMTAYIGPSAGVCCYQVGEEVARRFDKTVVTRRDGKVFLDLKSQNLKEMMESGIRPDHIEVSPHCTISEGHLFHSYRRERERSGRMMAVIGMK